jgi:hypothetical protein
MAKKVMGASPTEAHCELNVDKLDFVTVSKRVSPKKGSYLRFSKESILKIHEDEQSKDRESESIQVHEPGTAFASLSGKLAEISHDPKCSNLEVYFLSNKLVQNGNKVVEDGMWDAEICSFAVRVFNQETQKALRQEFDRSLVISILALWTRYGAGKLGILRLKPAPEDSAQVADKYEDWEGRAIAAYLHRHNL